MITENYIKVKNISIFNFLIPISGNQSIGRDITQYINKLSSTIVHKSSWSVTLAIHMYMLAEHFQLVHVCKFLLNITNTLTNSSDISSSQVSSLAGQMTDLPSDLSCDSLM